MESEDIKLSYEFSMEVRDKDGNVKPIFQENKFFRWLLDRGYVSPHFVKIPFILGGWSNKKVIKI